MKLKFLPFIFLIGVVLVSGCTTGKVTDEKVVNLAKCLGQKNATMYGAYWCSHCKNQKALFGEAVQYINYVECTNSTQLCINAGVQGYPTWIIDGKTSVGEQTLEELANAAGCQYS